MVDKIITEELYPIPTNNTTYKIAEIKVIILLPKCDTAHPAKGSAIIDPSGSINNIAPNSASLKWNFSFMEGIRAAQVEKVHPQQKKKMEIAIRCIRGCVKRMQIIRLKLMKKPNKNFGC